MAFNRSLVQKWYAPGRLFIRLVQTNGSYFRLNAFSCTGLFSLTDLTISPLLIDLIYNIRQTKTNFPSQSARKMHCIFLFYHVSFRSNFLVLAFLQENILRQSGFEDELEDIRSHLDCCRGGKLRIPLP